MKTNTFVVALASSFVSVHAAPSGNPGHGNNLSCRNVTIPVSSYKIFGSYCTPAAKSGGHENQRNGNHGHGDHLQVLVHGATYTRRYWSSLAEPGQGNSLYSWVEYAAKQGYPTLAIDRLCNGQSSHLNGTTSCSFMAQVEAVHGVVTAVRGGKVPSLQRKFSKIILVGHSYGSIVSNSLTAQHPNDVDTVFLTGFSKSNSPSPVTALALKPAQEVDPARFGYLHDPSYVASTNRSGYRTAFYDGKFDPKVFNLDYNTRGAITTSEFMNYTSFATASKFKGPVFVLNGNFDHIFCEKNDADANAGVSGNCAAGFSTEVQSLYPVTSKFGHFDIPKTGHCLNTHLTAQQAYKEAHDFMAQTGF